MGGYAFLSYIFWGGVSTSPNFNRDEWRIQKTTYYYYWGCFASFSVGTASAGLPGSRGAVPSHDA